MDFDTPRDISWRAGDHAGETLQGTHDYGDADTCRRTVFAWLTRYNIRRRHSANNHLSPNAYEHRHRTAKLTLAA
ncbi:hypothetical protein ACFVY1_38590 [Streptomyces sp. NPDC058293]|uniref:hypothetical protein n=2 Tax=unclassified Streptomyces TaxID=2593676 RepID=UPI0036EB09CC